MLIFRRRATNFPPGSQPSGFIPVASASSSGTFADQQAFTFYYPPGGLGAKPNALPLGFLPFGEWGGTSLATHPTLSRTQQTMVDPGNGNTFIQSSIVPPNAKGACQYIPTSISGNTSTAFGNVPQFSVPGGAGYQMYVFQKHYWNFSSVPLNDKFLRGWPPGGPGNKPDVYFALNKGAGDYIITVEDNDNATNLPTSGPGGHFVPWTQTTKVWDFREMWWQENSYGNSDGIMNMARNSQLAFPLNTTYGPCNSNNGTTSGNPTGQGPITQWYFDQYSADPPPNFSTDMGIYGCTVWDDSWNQLIVTNEGPVLNTTRVSDPPLSSRDFEREIQIQTFRSDTQINAVLRQGSFNKGTQYWVHAITGYLSSILLGTGVWQ
jgi:hypothetical protein